MPKALSISGLVVAIVMALVFGLDLALKLPFGRNNLVAEAGLLLAALLLAYVSWTTFREQP